MTNYQSTTHLPGAHCRCCTDNECECEGQRLAADSNQSPQESLHMIANRLEQITGRVAELGGRAAKDPQLASMISSAQDELLGLLEAEAGPGSREKP